QTEVAQGNHCNEDNEPDDNLHTSRLLCLTVRLPCYAQSERHNTGCASYPQCPAGHCHRPTGIHQIIDQQHRTRCIGNEFFKLRWKFKSIRNGSDTERRVSTRTILRSTSTICELPQITQPSDFR